MTEDIPYSHRFVASSDTGKRMARAFLGHAHRTRATWVGYSFFLALFSTALLMTLVGRTGVRLSQIVLALELALLMTLMFAVFTSTMRYFQIVKGSRPNVFSGAVLESGFGEDEVALRNTTASCRIAYKGIKSVTAHGDFVFMRQQGIPLVCLYPRELFPDWAIDRIVLGRAETPDRRPV